LAAPTLARNSGPTPHTAKATEASASSCHAYQQGADGSWTQLSCQETGSKTHGQPRSTAESPAEETQ
jgi:hypothetical protein